MKRSIHIFFAALALLFFSGVASAVEGESIDSEPGSPDTVTAQGVDLLTRDYASLGELLEIAFESSPVIQSARSEWKASVEQFPQARSWPDPQLGVLWMPESEQFRTGSYDLTFELMQMIPNPFRLSLMGDRSITMAESARVKYEATVRDVLSDVMVSYFELGYLATASDIALNNRDLFAQLVDLGNLRYSQGEIAASELYSAESKLAQSEYELILLQELTLVEKSNLLSLLGLDHFNDIGTIYLPSITHVDFNLEEIRSLVIQYRQELEMAGLSVELAEQNLSIARLRRAPDFTLGIMYDSMTNAPSTGEMMTPVTDGYGITFGVTLPIWGAKNDARIDEAQARLDAAVADRENAENSAIANADKVYYKLSNNQRLVELYSNTLLPNARQAAMLSQTWYEAGQVSFSELLESRLVVSNFELASARAKADYLESLIELQKIIGSPVLGWGTVPDTALDLNPDEEQVVENSAEVSG